ncbi:hypothetical protein GW916_15660, partial [bacterium]|nr:hypothetical protein [bacterium]
MQPNIKRVSYNNWSIVYTPSVEFDWNVVEEKLYPVLDKIKGMAIVTPWYLDPKGNIYFSGGDITKNTCVPMPYNGDQPDIGQRPGTRNVVF